MVWITLFLIKAPGVSYKHGCEKDENAAERDVKFASKE